jgi:allantoinase
MVVSDHSPCIPDLKRLDTGDFMAAWGGIAGLQYSFSAVWTGARATAS